MEMTICRDRWQMHLKTHGQFYHDMARQLEELHKQNDRVGAQIVSYCLHGLAELLEVARVAAADTAPAHSLPAGRIDRPRRRRRQPGAARGTRSPGDAECESPCPLHCRSTWLRSAGFPLVMRP